jgi:hypothetical protein
MRRSTSLTHSTRPLIALGWLSRLQLATRERAHRSVSTACDQLSVLGGPEERLHDDHTLSVERGGR